MMDLDVSVMVMHQIDETTDRRSCLPVMKIEEFIDHFSIVELRIPQEPTHQVVTEIGKLCCQERILGLHEDAFDAVGQQRFEVRLHHEQIGIWQKNVAGAKVVIPDIDVFADPAPSLQVFEELDIRRAVGIRDQMNMTASPRGQVDLHVRPTLDRFRWFA